MYTEYPDEDKIVFDDNFNIEISEELAEIIKKYANVEFPSDYSHPIDNIYYQVIKIGIYTIFQPNGTLELKPDYTELITQEIIDRFPTTQQIVVGFNYPHKFDVLPESIFDITYEWKYSISRDNPETIYILDETEWDDNILYSVSKYSKIIFSDSYNKPLGQFPDSIREVLFRTDFNQPIDILENCNSIKKITFYSNSDFNQLIDRLPKNLTHLYLSRAFNQSIDKLPDNLLVLVIQGDFNQPINCLPYNLVKLTINSDTFNYPLDNLPNSLKNLTLIGREFNYPLDNLPEGLEYLDIEIPTHTYIQNLPNSLIGLKINSYTDSDSDFEIKNLPDSIQILNLNNLSDFEIINLPTNLISLKLGEKFNSPIISYPTGLKHISYGSKFNQSVENLPDSLEFIEFGKKFNQPINRYPSNLKKIYFNANFNKPIDNLPESLEEIFIGLKFNNSLDNLPDSLKVLEFYSRHNNKLNKIPKNLEKISGYYESLLNLSEIKSNYPNLVFENSSENEENPVFSFFSWNDDYE